MNKSKVIEIIYKDPEYIKICRQIVSYGNYQDHQDLFHEVICILLEKTEQEILNAYEAKFIKFLFIRIANNQYRSKTSPFHKKYRGMLDLVSIDDVTEKHTDIKEIDEVQNAKMINDLVSSIESLKEYDKQLFKVWFDLGMSSAEVARRTGIEQQNISKKILKIRKQLAEKHGTDYFDSFN